MFYCMAEVKIPLKCINCSFTTFHDDDLKLHMHVHVQPTFFSCNVCGRRYKHYYSVKRHMQIHFKEATYKCTECDYTCYRSEYLKAHKKKHKESNRLTTTVPLKCKVCPFTTDDEVFFKSHLDSHTKEQPKRDECDSSTTKLLLGFSNGEEKTYKCNKCSFSSMDLLHLKAHIWKHNYKCKLCDYTTAKKGNFVVHFRIHTGEKPYKCTMCDFTCKQFTHLKRHVRNHDKDNLFGCSTCDYRTGEGKELATHIRMHDDLDLSFLVDLHDSTQYTKPKLFFVENTTPPRKKCTKTKLHKCIYCDYITNQTGNLKRHQKTHFKEAPEKPSNDVGVSKPISVNALSEKVFDCPECPFKASRKHQMDIHMRSHNGKKLYECNLCHYKTVNKFNFSRHQKTHTFGESNGGMSQLAGHLATELAESDTLT